MSTSAGGGSHRPVSRYGGPSSETSLADLLEMVLDRGVVVAGDIVVGLLGIELLSLKLRLLIASVDTARQMGIDWWERDPFLNSKAAGDAHRLEAENKELKARLAQLEGPGGGDGSRQAEQLGRQPDRRAVTADTRERDGEDERERDGERVRAAHEEPDERQGSRRRAGRADRNREERGSQQ